MKLLATNEHRKFGWFLKGVLKRGFSELALLMRVSLESFLIELLQEFVTFCQKIDAGYLEASMKNSVAGKRSEAIMPSVPRNLVIPRHTAARPSSTYAFQPAIAAAPYSPKDARDTLRESGYLVNEIGQFARSLARLGR